jgi:hypothetical protein
MNHQVPVFNWDCHDQLGTAMGSHVDYEYLDHYSSVSR